MPLRTITLEDGSERSRYIISTHPDGTEFLPEKYALSGEADEVERIYRALERLINSSPHIGSVKR